MNTARIVTCARNARTQGKPRHFATMASPGLVALSAEPAHANTATQSRTAKSAASDAPMANARSDARTAAEAAYVHTADARTNPARNATGEQRQPQSRRANRATPAENHRPARGVPAGGCLRTLEEARVYVYCLTRLLLGFHTARTSPTDLVSKLCLVVLHCSWFQL